MLLEQGLRRSVRLWPEKLAVVDGPHHFTYAELNERVNRLANALIDLGVQRGDRVGVLMFNSFRYLELYYAVNVAGGIIVPLNYRLAVPELSFMLNDCAARLLFVNHEFLDAARQFQADCPSLEALILAEDGPALPGWLAYEELLASAVTVCPVVTVQESDIAGIFYTGGTTSLPKGVMLSHRNLVDNAYRAIIQLGYGPDDVYLHAAPMFHLADGSATCAVTQLGGTHAHVRAFNPESVLRCIERDRITSIVLVPTMITALINSPMITEVDLSSFRRLSYGGSPIAATTLRRAMELLGCEFRQVYGMTEAAPILTTLSPKDHRLDQSEGSRRLRSAGQACIGIDLKVVDEAEREVVSGTVGEILVRGDNVMLGYWERPEETAGALRGGWYHTGDLGTMDEDGYIYIVDRKKDMIISGGENIYSVEVEHALASHPSVLECAVIGVPDDKWGESVLGVVVLRAGHEVGLEDLIAHCRERIAHYKAPKAIVFAESLPKSGAGKILKRELREVYWRDEVRQVH
jgi:long-chain acyl-CoA synthetase